MEQDENMCGLVGKREQRGELGTHNTHSMAGTKLPAFRWPSAEGRRGNHHPVTCSKP